MPHVTFIHGIKNKPAREHLLEEYRTGLLDDDGLDLADEKVTTSVVYWADLLYPFPSPRVGYREAVPGSDDTETETLDWLRDAPPEERDFVERLARETGIDLHDLADPGDDEIITRSPLETLPIPGVVKKHLMRAFLRDVHHYLYDVEFAPRPGETYRIRTEIRRRALQELNQASGEPHVIVAHSLGTVIAYDLLAAVPETPAVEALITLGSPLGLTEVLDRLTPPWSSHDGWPDKCLSDRRWWNVYDRLDPVCAAAPQISGRFKRQGVSQINDVGVTNRTFWRHGLNGYLNQHEVRQILRQALGVPG